MGQKQKSKIVKKTLYPEYYETFIFDNVIIPDADNYTYSPQITFRVYDDDVFGSDDYLGQCSFSLSDAMKCITLDEEMPDPIWIPLFKELPNDSSGSLLIQVQVVRVLADGENIDILEKPSPSIIPEHVDAFIEVIAVGIRDLLPYNFLPMQYPFLEFELNSLGNRYVQTTEVRTLVVSR